MPEPSLTLIPEKNSKKINTMRVVLIGNPNAGKTTVFNALCGVRQKTANYPGATVDYKEGRLKLPDGDVSVLDLPGLYSLQATSFDESIALDALKGQLPGLDMPDLVLCILDLSNIKRNLLLYSQLSELNIPIVIVATMEDLLPEQGLVIDLNILEKKLGQPVIQLIQRNRDTIQDLKDAIGMALAQPRTPRSGIDLPVEYVEALEQLASHPKAAGMHPLDLTQLFDGDLKISSAPNDLVKLAAELRRNLREQAHINHATITIRRYHWIDKILTSVQTRMPGNFSTHSERIDRVLVHKFWGPLIFAGVMFFVFWSIYSGAGPLMDGIEFLMQYSSDVVGGLLEGMPDLQSLVTDGIITGVGSVVVFLPQILILFFFIALLEDSGYLARAAYLMDRMLGWCGLNGRAFIPMLSSFACAVPGVMAARVMPDPRSRLTTILVAPLMSCSARLPVYVLMIGALIEPQLGSLWAATILFGMHVLGLAIALPVALIMNRGILKTPGIPFLLELPMYRRPVFRNIIFRTYESGLRFLKQAGTIIFAMSIIIWALSYYPRSNSIQAEIESKYAAEFAALSERSPATENQYTALTEKMQKDLDTTYQKNSYLGQAGQAIEPIFRPLGFDWKISVGILASFPAREVIVATLGIVYNVGEADEDSKDLRQSMLSDQHPDGRPVFTPLVGISLMIFFALCSQCMSTLATVYRELKSWKWPVIQFLYMTALAYGLSLLVYQVGRALGFS